MKYYPTVESLSLLFDEDKLLLLNDMIRYARKNPSYDAKKIYQAEDDLFRNGRLSASTYNYLLEEYERFSMWECIDVQ